VRAHLPRVKICADRAASSPADTSAPLPSHGEPLTTTATFLAYRRGDQKRRRSMSSGSLARRCRSQSPCDTALPLRPLILSNLIYRERIAHEQDDWSNWRETRHIDNEPQLLEHIQSGMRRICESQGCRYSQMDREPERWALDGVDDGTVELRFATIGTSSFSLSSPASSVMLTPALATPADPVTQAIETQIDFVGQ
jgi:hypothetical protein